MSELKQTDLSKRLREYAANASYRLTGDTFALLAAAADEIDRYYTGMLNWKATAEAQNRAQPEANADAKNAERYRWYRSCGDERDQLAILDARGNIIPEELDAEIDARIAAIQAQKDGHG